MYHGKRCIVFKVNVEDENKSKNKNKQINNRMDTILNCGNPDVFEDIILRHLSENNEFGFRKHLYKFVIELAHTWSDEGLHGLKEIAQKDIVSLDLGLQMDERRKNLSEFVTIALSKLD